MAEEKKGAVQESSKASGIVKDEDKTFMYCQKSTKTGTADGTYTIELYFEKESKVKNKRSILDQKTIKHPIVLKDLLI